jgi:hypothetical protein
MNIWQAHKIDIWNDITCINMLDGGVLLENVDSMEVAGVKKKEFTWP